MAKTEVSEQTKTRRRKISEVEMMCTNTQHSILDRSQSYSEDGTNSQYNIAMNMNANNYNVPQRSRKVSLPATMNNQYQIHLVEEPLPTESIARSLDNVATPMRERHRAHSSGESEQEKNRRERKKIFQKERRRKLSQVR